MIGIVTVLYKSDEVLEDFYSSLSMQDFRDFVLILVDNDANEGTSKKLEFLGGKYSGLNTIYINSGGNVGVAAGNNLGIRKAMEFSCSHILISNNDLFFDDRTLISGLLDLSLNFNKRVVTPKILYYDTKKIWMAGGYFSKWRSLGIHYGNHAKPDDPKYNFSRSITYSPTCFMLINREVFDQVGLMDEKYFVYVDDTDFIYRCVQAKIDVWYEHSKTILHKVSSSTGGEDSPFYIYYSNRNKLYFIGKHYSMIAKIISLIHFSITRVLFFLRFSSKQREALLKGIRDGIKLN